MIYLKNMMSASTDCCVVVIMKSITFGNDLDSPHPETLDGDSEVFIWEMSNFL